MVFSHSLSIKLDDTNFLLWRQQVYVAIRNHKLGNFISKDFIPPKFVTTENLNVRVLNPDFIDWDQQDQLLFSWLLSSMSESMLPRMAGCETSA